MTQTPAGWLPAPDRPGELRYWDGERWTDNYAPMSAEAAAMRAKPRILSDQRRSGGLVVLAWIVAACTLGYMLPWAVAETRGKSNSGAIALVNLLLGWTFVGWIVALVMACTSHQKFLAN